MAAALAVVTPVRSWGGDSKYHVYGTLAVDASPATYTTGGIAMSLVNPLIKATRVPLYVRVFGINGYQYAYIAGTDSSSGLLKILASTTEASAASIPAGVSGDTIKFLAVWDGMN